MDKIVTLGECPKCGEVLPMKRGGKYLVDHLNSRGGQCQIRRGGRFVEIKPVGPAERRLANNYNPPTGRILGGWP